MKYLLTLALLLLVGCFGTETKNKDSQIVVKFNKSASQGFAKVITSEGDTLPDEFVDTLSLDTIDDRIKLTYPVTTNQAYNVDVTGAITCNTQVGSSVTANVTIDSLEVNTLLTTQGCVIEVDVLTDTLAYTQRMAALGNWNLVREFNGLDLDDSLLVHLYIRDTTQYSHIPYFNPEEAAMWVKASETFIDFNINNFDDNTLYNLVTDTTVSEYVRIVLRGYLNKVHKLDVWNTTQEVDDAYNELYAPYR